jgi:hypothetical protein
MYFSASSPSIRKLYCSALGQLAKVAKKAQLTKLLDSIRDMYIGERADLTSKQVCQLLI